MSPTSTCGTWAAKRCDIAHKDGTLKAFRRGQRKRGLEIIKHMYSNPTATYKEIANSTGYSRSWVGATIKRLQEQGVIERVGADKNGHWRIIIAEER